MTKEPARRQGASLAQDGLPADRWLPRCWLGLCALGLGHELPAFFLMEKTLFLYHYLPALTFPSCCCPQVVLSMSVTTCRYWALAATRPWVRGWGPGGAMNGEIAAVWTGLARRGTSKAPGVLSTKLRLLGGETRGYTRKDLWPRGTKKGKGARGAQQIHRGACKPERVLGLGPGQLRREVLCSHCCKHGAGVWSSGSRASEEGRRGGQAGLDEG